MSWTPQSGQPISKDEAHAILTGADTSQNVSEGQNPLQQGVSSLPGIMATAGGIAGMQNPLTQFVGTAGGQMMGTQMKNMLEPLLGMAPKDKPIETLPKLGSELVSAGKTGLVSAAINAPLWGMGLTPGGGLPKMLANRVTSTVKGVTSGSEFFDALKTAIKGKAVPGDMDIAGKVADDLAKKYGAKGAASLQNSSGNIKWNDLLQLRRDIDALGYKTTAVGQRAALQDASRFISNTIHTQFPETASLDSAISTILRTTSGLKGMPAYIARRLSFTLPYLVIRQLSKQKH